MENLGASRSLPPFGSTVIFTAHIPYAVWAYGCTNPSNRRMARSVACCAPVAAP